MGNFNKIFSVLIIAFLLLAIADYIQDEKLHYINENQNIGQGQNELLSQNDNAISQISEVSSSINSSGNFTSIVETPVKYASVNGITIGYREFGSGEPLLVILPFSATMDMCNDTFIRQLASKNRVILFDNRGMGYSSENNEMFSISLFSNDTSGLIDALGLTSANIFGSSMGAVIAQELALDHPEKVDRLILSSATYSPGFHRQSF